MINIVRGQVYLEGSDELLLIEIALILAGWKSRMLSKGKRPEETYHMIQSAIEASDKHYITDLQSTARAAAEQERNAH